MTRRSTCATTLLQSRFLNFRHSQEHHQKNVETCSLRKATSLGDWDRFSHDYLATCRQRPLCAFTQSSEGEGIGVPQLQQPITASCFRDTTMVLANFNTPRGNASCAKVKLPAIQRSVCVKHPLALRYAQICLLTAHGCRDCD